MTGDDNWYSDQPKKRQRPSTPPGQKFFSREEYREELARVRGKQARGDYDREKAFDLQHWSELKGGLPKDLQKAIEEAERRRKEEG